MPQDNDLKRVEQLIAGLGGASGGGRRGEGPCGLLLEHLEAARRDLLGTMLGEYKSSLQHATDSIACISDQSARAEMKKTLRSLLDSA